MAQKKLTRKQFYRHVGARLALAREEQGLSQRALARAANMSPVAVTWLEDGSHSPTLGHLYGVADVLGLSPAMFLMDNSAEDPLQKLRVILDGQPPEMLAVVEKCASAVVSLGKVKK